MPENSERRIGNKTADSVVVGRGKPMHVGIFGIPRKLLLGVDARVFLQPRHGSREIHRAVEIGKHLLVAYGVERIEVAQRIDAAAEYLMANPDTVCIASGGQGDDEGISEAGCIRRYLINYGIDPERVLLEDKSTSTLTNIENSLKLLPEGAENIGIVTNDFHIFRALATARHVSALNFSGISAPSTGYGFTHYAMREFFAAGAGLIKGELSF